MQPMQMRFRVPKLRTWRQCSMLVREQRTRLYIMWRCAIILMSRDE
ncbi:hypothetical protein MLD38_020496 [Melastoma candidum]|uniref:Uncharacterized protein n=1 Tax=Melastoma candidum TaxID=119954 RepID=A0ACB9QG53_9MYRT|nr:hypothetical protein MLD38_020496 [Melastoma candidum]